MTDDAPRACEGFGDIRLAAAVGAVANRNLSFALRCIDALAKGGTGKWVVSQLRQYRKMNAEKP